MPDNPLILGTTLAALAALAFGATTPFIQRFGTGLTPFATASLLYLGAAIRTQALADLSPRSDRRNPAAHGAAWAVATGPRYSAGWQEPGVGDPEPQASPDDSHDPALARGVGDSRRVPHPTHDGQVASSALATNRCVAREVALARVSEAVLDPWGSQPTNCSRDAGPAKRRCDRPSQAPKAERRRMIRMRPASLFPARG
jgi:hypothetical protein